MICLQTKTIALALHRFNSIVYQVRIASVSGDEDGMVFLFAWCVFLACDGALTWSCDDVFSFESDVLMTSRD